MISIWMRERRPMSAESTKDVSQAIIWDAFAGVSGLIEYAQALLGTAIGQNLILKTSNRLQAIRYGLVNKAIHEKLRLIVLESRLLRKIENITSWPRYSTMVMEALPDNEDLFIPLVTIVTNKTEKGTDIKGKRDKRHQNICHELLQYKRTVSIVKQPTRDGYL